MLHTISFVGTVAAGSTKVLSSKQINFPFTFMKLICSFALNQARTVQISFFHSHDAETPTTGIPSGSNLIQFLSQARYLVGDDDKKVLEANIESEDWPSWIKIYANNTDGSDHNIDCQVIIETPDQPKKEPQ